MISIDPKVPIKDSTSWHVPIEELEPLKLRVFKNPKRLIETSHLRDDFYLKKHIVDGQNSVPVVRQFIPLFTGFYTSKGWCKVSSINSGLGCNLHQGFFMGVPNPYAGGLVKYISFTQLHSQLLSLWLQDMVALLRTIQFLLV